MRTQISTEDGPIEVRKHFWQKNKLRNLFILTTTIISIHSWIVSANKEKITIVVNPPFEEKKNGFLERIFGSRR